MVILFDGLLDVRGPVLIKSSHIVDHSSILVNRKSVCGLGDIFEMKIGSVLINRTISKQSINIKD